MDNRVGYEDAIEYIGATRSGLMQPLSLEEWNEMDRDWIETLLDTWQVFNEQDSEESAPLSAETQMQQSLVQLQQRG